ncbi:PilZ domain-containing protein [Pseudoteredinibacter isoporae]|uniref:Tfp pilus assembly protein PilZ n=1 Tax=Pseudoteredinibacter isoporae TaxID=570281 RepID=A0A7X0JUM6_9GAMM|nr:PilZ domain-containing protein [Pseudoteredinibacter isoporae]MBB6521696.1 Tfp pilus assembly protein PilZ [Pseudoteredinibacter isoporae]NHO87244.1 PilZ domain-containing protein [Pseudoteredinibacter isoporae]NIB23124.1 PilZ domain-containing protein [Pseudoteredinibacter isoporae]
MNQHNSKPQDDSQRPPNGHDRRCHYRVDDQLYFEFKPVNPKTMRQQQASELFVRPSELTLLQELHKLEEEGQSLLREIAKEQRSVAIYLSLLNRKTQLIAQQMCQAQSEQHTVQLNLSEGGLAFQHNSALNVGDYVAVTLGLEEDAWHLYLYGRIVRCLPAVPAGYQIAIAFCDLDSEQQKLLTRRVFKKQMQSHRRKRGMETPSF